MFGPAIENSAGRKLYIMIFWHLSVFLMFQFAREKNVENGREISIKLSCIAGALGNTSCVFRKTQQLIGSKSSASTVCVTRLLILIETVIMT
jgi:hypothetical protein